MRIIGLIIFIAGMGIGIGTNISAMLHLECAAMVVGGTLGLLLFGGSRIGPMFGSVFRCSIPAADLLQAARDWKLAAAYRLPAGLRGDRHLNWAGYHAEEHGRSGGARSGYGHRRADHPLRGHCGTGNLSAAGRTPGKPGTGAEQSELNGDGALLCQSRAPDNKGW